MSTDLRQLSDREREILQLVATGLSNQQIAGQLGISANTVKVHLRNIFAKIGAASRTEATMYAVRSGLVEVEGVSPREVEPVTEVVSASDATPTPTLATPSASETADPPAVTTPDEAHGNGVADAHTQTTVVEHTAPTTQPVRSVSSTTTGRNQVAMFAVAALVLIVGAVGGFWLINRARATSTPPGNGQVQPNAAVQRWEEATALTSPRAGFATANLDSFVYVIGGEGSSGVLDVVERFDPRSATWTGLRKKPTAVADVKAVVIGRKIYVPGGRRANAASEITAAFEAYDPRTDTWEQLPELPEPRSAYGLGTLEGKLYLFGGWDGKAYRDDVLAYDPDAERWDTRTPMPTARAYLDVAVVQDSIYVLGGENQSGPLSNNEQYIPAAEDRSPWSTKAPLPEPRSRFGTAEALGMLYVLGGEQPAAPVEYDIRTDSWRPLETPPHSLGSQLGVVQNNVQILALGGRLTDDQYTAQALQYRAFFQVILPQSDVSR